MDSTREIYLPYAKSDPPTPSRCRGMMMDFEVGTQWTLGSTPPCIPVGLNEGLYISLDTSYVQEI
ncbi:hypothetical protein MAR_036096 [Mya arenaria]|uniref:Uncharacterized protein n=1 Tax=Mya arenaria TaxID=6604 RepID=A0ABY7EP60_MYAAR|nr:hypothetical protein MAR_036096 [Mya arenaria]